MSEYDVISNFRTEFSPLILSNMRFFWNFFISQPIKLKFGTGIQDCIMMLISGSKSGFGNDFGQYDTKTIILHPFLAVFLAKCLLDTALSWQHLRPQVIKNYLKGCVICQNWKWQSLRFLHLMVSELYLENQLGGGGKLAPLSKTGLNMKYDSKLLVSNICHTDIIICIKNLPL